MDCRLTFISVYPNDGYSVDLLALGSCNMLTYLNCVRAMQHCTARKVKTGIVGIWIVGGREWSRPVVV
jgi:hypothetical protein